MTHAAQWTMRLSVAEEGDVTKVTAVLDAPGKQVTGHGVARRNPRDPQVPEIGDELAAGRALADVARQLIRTAVEDIVELDPQHARDSESTRLWL